MPEEVENSEEELVEEVDETEALRAENEELIDTPSASRPSSTTTAAGGARSGEPGRARPRGLVMSLPVLDDLERALGAAEQHEEAKLEDGVRLVHRPLAEALAREGLAEIETEGKFDPHVQEALLTQPSEAEEGPVIEVLQRATSRRPRRCARHGWWSPA